MLEYYYELNCDGTIIGKTGYFTYRDIEASWVLEEKKYLLERYLKGKPSDYLIKCVYFLKQRS